MQLKANKPLYVFLSALLGALLLLIIHRTLVLVYAVMLNSDPLFYSFGLSYHQLSLVEFYSLIIFLLAGLWYGVWIGEYWYRIVYETGRYGGVMHHVLQSLGDSDKALVHVQKQVQAVQQKVAEEAWKLEELSQEIEQMPVKKAPAKKRVVRKKTVKKDI